MASALAVPLTFAFGACILLAIPCWMITISVDDTLPLKATAAAAAGPVAYAQTTDNINSATSSNSKMLMLPLRIIRILLHFLLSAK